MTISSRDVLKEIVQLIGVDFEKNLTEAMLEISKLGGLEKISLSDDCRKVELSIKIRALYSLRRKFNDLHSFLHFNFFSHPSEEFIESDFWRRDLWSFYFRSLKRREDIAEKLILDLMEIEFLEMGVMFPFRDSLKIESDTYLYLKGKKEFKKIC